MISRWRSDARLTPLVLLAAALFGVFAWTRAGAAQTGTYAAIYAIAAIGLSVLLGNVNQISLGQAGFFAIAAYTVAYLTTNANWPFLPAALAGIVLATLAGFAIGVIALRFRGHYLAMATLAFGLIVTGILHESKALGGASGITLAGIPAVGPFPFTGASGYVLSWVAAAIVALLTLNLLRARTGRAFETIRNDELAAEMIGVPTRRYKILAFAYAGALAGLAGTMYAAVLGIVTPEALSVALSIDFLLMVVLGGRGFVGGALLGAVLIAYLNISGQQFENSREVAYGVLVILVVIAIPGGLVSLVLRLRRAIVAFGRQSQTERSRGGQPPVEPVTAVAPLAGGAAADGASPLVVDAVTKRFGGLVAVDTVSFTLERGRLTSLIGPNGAGKTTLFNAVVGIGTLSSGRVTVGGTDVTGWQPHRVAALGVGRTFQNARLFAEMTVLENVMAGAFRLERSSFGEDLLGMPRARRAERVALERARATLARLNLEALAHTPARDLPFGARRRVELARALAAEPWLLLADEPAAGLNAAERAALHDDLAALRTSGITILLVEHDMRLVMSISDRVMVLEFGKKIADGEPAVVRNDPRVVAAYLGTSQ